MVTIMKEGRQRFYISRMVSRRPLAIVAGDLTDVARLAAVLWTTEDGRGPSDPMRLTLTPHGPGDYQELTGRGDGGLLLAPG